MWVDIDKLPTKLVDMTVILKGIRELKQSPWFNNIYGYADRKEAVEIIEDLCIKMAPTVDAVEVVRCKDCKYFEPDLMPIPYFEGDGVCCHEHWKLEDVGFEVKETDFCSYGERKEE